jgi:hypothetical protein
MMNRFKSLVQSVACAILGVGAVLAGNSAAVASTPQIQNPEQVLQGDGWHVIRSDEHGLLLELTAPDYTLKDGQIVMPGADRLAVPGKPDLPKFSALIGIPSEETVTVQVLQDDLQVVADRQAIAPAPSPFLPTGDLQPGAVRRTPDQVAYANRALYPVEVARVADTAWLRDQHLVRLEAYPFQYRAATQELVWHRRLLIEVKFTGVTSANRSVMPNSMPTNDPFEAILQEKVLNYAVARQWRSIPAEPTAAVPARLTLTATEPRYKIVVNHDGVYRVTYEDLQAAGLDVNAIDPRQLQMTNQGLPVAMTVVGEADGHFDPSDYVLFYGQKLRGDLLASKWITESNNWLTYNGWHPQFDAFMVERYTDNNVYWLTVGTAPGLRMATQVGTPRGSAFTPDYYTATARAEEVSYWRTTTFTGEDPFFWERVNGITSIVTRTYPITLTALAAQNLSATVTGEVVAAVQNSAVAPDHRTQFYLNDMAQPFEDMTWDGITRHRFTGSVPLTALHEGQNDLVFAAILQPALSSDEMLFDWFKIDYARRFQADAGALTFRSDQSGAVQYNVQQLTSADAVVFEISDPWLPQQIISPNITTSGGGYTVSFEVSQTMPLTYVVADRNAWRSPVSLTRYAPTVDLHDPNNGADYIVITPRDFITGAQTLADYRATQGLRTQVVDLEDVFNQFTDGIFHPIAIKAFLKYAYYHWRSPAPAYVLLVGDGHWNFKNYNIANYSSPAYTPVYMPPYLVWVDPWQGEVDSSSLLAAVAGDDVMPDMAIGRLPVNSVAEMNTVVSKTLAYEQTAPQDWQRRLMFVADNVPDPLGAGDFVALSEQAINQYAPPSYAIDRVYENNFNCPNAQPCPAVNYAITNTLNQMGALLVNYVGHGSTFRWSHERILVNANVPTFDNLDRLPVILSLTCLDGYWSHPDVLNNSSLMETMLRAPNGGDVASFSPTGLGVATGHDVLQQGFYAAAFTAGLQRFGAATLAAKAQLFATGQNLDLVSTFTVFGDPALRLPTYALDLKPTAAEKIALPTGPVQYTLHVTNTAFLTDTLTISAAGDWPVTSSVLGLTLPPGASTSFVVTVSVPVTVTNGAGAPVTVTIQSHGDATRVVAYLTTTALVPQSVVYLPLVLRGN